MGRFWTDAQSIFETASSASRHDPADMMILSGANGLRVVQAQGWSLAAAVAHHGADAGYHVTRQNGTVRVQARCANAQCDLRNHQSIAPLWLRDAPRYAVTNPLALGAPA
jgi:hypothetical protein